MAAEPESVVAVVAAYRRPALLSKLLDSLPNGGSVRKVIVVDNGLDSETEKVCGGAPLPVSYHRPETNLGCGGGVARGLSLGLREEGVTHFCLFDDDAQATPGAIAKLVEGMTLAKAELAVPLVLDAKGHVSWFPGLEKGRAWNIIRRPGLLPEDYRAACGLDPVAFTWAPWPTLALSARVVRECGFPRDDFWFSVEDLEYTLRLTYRHRGVMVPTAVCRHLPPDSSGEGSLGGGHYLRFCLLLQNLSFISTRLPHARRVLRHLPGNYVRFLRTFGVSSATLRDEWLAWWRGGMRGKPAGVTGGDGFKQRLLKLSRRGKAENG